MKFHINPKPYLFVLILAISAWGSQSQAQNSEADTQQIQFSFSGKKYWGDQVLTTGSHPFNQMAKKVEIEINNLKIISSRDFLNAFGAQAAYVYKLNTIFIGSYVQNQNPLNQQSFIHELIHAYIANRLADGELFPFSGYATNNDPAITNLSYGAQFSLDEVTANLFSLFYNTKISKQSLKINSAYHLRMGIFDILEYSNRIKRMLTTLQIALSPMARVAAGDEHKVMNYDNIQWQTFANDRVKLVAPANITAKTRESIMALSKEILPLVEKINLQFTDLQKLDESNISVLNINAAEYIDLSEQILKIYQTHFPEDANIWRKFFIQ